MNARLDSPFESSGLFHEAIPGSSNIHGRLSYDPSSGIKLELVENPRGPQYIDHGASVPFLSIYGQLVDGTPVTLVDCFITNAAFQIGVDVGSPTTLRVNRALFGQYVPDPDQLAVKEYSAELSSLTNWAFGHPVRVARASADGGVSGFDVTCRRMPPIEVILSNTEFDLRIDHLVRTRHSVGAFSIEWSASATIVAHGSLPLKLIRDIAWQWQNLLTLLIGEAVSVLSVTITPAFEAPVAGRQPAAREISQQEIAERAYEIYSRRGGRPGDQDADWRQAEQELKDKQQAPSKPPLQLLFKQFGKHDHEAVHAALMLLPYGNLKEDFAKMAEKWFARPEQAVLATNLFFGSSSRSSPIVNEKFLAAIQAVESYHRSLGTGLYMDQAAFDAEMQQFAAHIPAGIEGDHRQSLKNRLKYGNEYSLRKRLAEMLTRLPENARLAIAGDTRKFIAKIVDTRNFYTHYDHVLQSSAFAGQAAYVAAERLHILLVANLFHDLGVQAENMLTTLQRSQRFAHWMRQELPL